MNEIDRLCLRCQQVNDTANELNAALISSKANYQVLALQPLTANLLSFVTNLLTFKEKVFYSLQNKYSPVQENYFFVGGLTGELSFAHQAVSAYRSQQSNCYCIGDNRPEYLLQTKLTLNDIKVTFLLYLAETSLLLLKTNFLRILKFK
jgi:hypothetical protein